MSVYKMRCEQLMLRIQWVAVAAAESDESQHGKEGRVSEGRRGRLGRWEHRREVDGGEISSRWVLD